MRPSATYRLQLTPAFGFDAAAAVAPYLARLGVSHLYLSPVLKARAGSQHGYDVIDANAVNPELGGEEGFARLCETLDALDLGILMDIVPNHMAASPENDWWWSVLENGHSSEYSGYFDIAWYEGASGVPVDRKVLLPILGNHYGVVLEEQELRIVIDGRGLTVAYYDNRMPLGPKTYRMVLEQRYGLLKERLAGDAEGLRAYEGLIELCDEMPDRFTTEPSLVRRRREETGRLKEQLWQLYTSNDVVREFIDENIALVNGQAGDPSSFDTLDRILSDQAYRLAYWRVASTEINYRRFFDIADLVSMRVEDPDVFAARHARLAEMERAGQVSALRVDHVDGLHDPGEYLERLQALMRAARSERGGQDGGYYLVVEKILTPGEDLPAGWPVAGTTGYDFLNLVNALFVDRRSETALDALYRRVSGIDDSFAEIVYHQKRKVMADLFSGDVRSLVVWLDRLTAWDRYGRDLGQRELGQALTELVARFPVYRTYTTPAGVRDEDRAVIEEVVDAAIQHRPELRRALRFIRRVLLLQPAGYLEAGQEDERVPFVMRLQQFTGPVMAKGYEDTALYVFNQLISLNDVGGEPEDFGIDPDAFHAAVAARAERWPSTMNATSTHDTKRSEDVRARINVLSELADDWADAVDRWRRENSGLRGEVDGASVPDGNTEYLIYQTLVGAWPLDADGVPEFGGRLKQYLEKAGREAKQHTSWIDPNAGYESAVAAFVDAVLAPGNRAFLDDFEPFQREVAWFGALSSLAQVVLKATVPGVPDFYQGTELWDLSLVDPDNRRSVDFDRREVLLDALGESPDIAALLAGWRDGAIKLHLTGQLARYRRRRRALFDLGEYLPLQVVGARREHAVALARRHGDGWSVVVVPRLVATLARAAGLAPEQPPVGVAAWADTRVLLPDGAPTRWRDVLSGATREASSQLPLASFLDVLPLAVLDAETGAADATPPDRAR